MPHDVKNNTEFLVYLYAETVGGKWAYKQLLFNISFPTINDAPVFDSPLERWTVEVNGNDQLFGYEEPILTYIFP